MDSVETAGGEVRKQVVGRLGGVGGQDGSGKVGILAGWCGGRLGDAASWMRAEAGGTGREAAAGSAFFPDPGSSPPSPNFPPLRRLFHSRAAGID